MPVNIMKHCVFYFLGFLAAVGIATASKISHAGIKLSPSTEIAAEIIVVPQDSCAISEYTPLANSSVYHDNKQEP